MTTVCHQVTYTPFLLTGPEATGAETPLRLKMQARDPSSCSLPDVEVISAYLGVSRRISAYLG